MDENRTIKKEFNAEPISTRRKSSQNLRWVDGLERDLLVLKTKNCRALAGSGNRSDSGRTGSGTFSNTPGSDFKISIRNSDHCSVFRSELIANSGALNSNKDSIWILTDNSSSIQYLKNWPQIMDNTGPDIIPKLARRGQRKQVCLQWTPSHVGVFGNEANDELDGRGCHLPNPNFSVLNHSEIHSLHKVIEIVIHIYCDGALSCLYTNSLGESLGPELSYFTANPFKKKP
ncbi:RNase H domain-containing protein [Trichonephila clavipes]|nr:RNase H domain-containing protein [Trichonephila clavipes]